MMVFLLFNVLVSGSVRMREGIYGRRCGAKRCANARGVGGRGSRANAA